MKTLLPLSSALLFLVGCAANEAYVTPSEGHYDGQYRAQDDGYRGGAMPTAAPGDAAEAESDGGGFSFGGVDVLGELMKPSGARVAEAPPAPRAPQPAEPAGPAAEESPAVADDRAPHKRLMIYRADYTVMVANVDDSVDKLLARAEALGGYLQSRASGTVVVRVPAKDFFTLTEELGDYGTITSETLQAQDVTKQFLDLQLRIETATKSRARLLELLKQATEMEDILAIENEVRRLTQEIESMKGELRYLGDQISFSTLTVRFMSNAPPPSPYPQRKVSRFPWINAVGIERVLYDF